MYKCKLIFVSNLKFYLRNLLYISLLVFAAYDNSELLLHIQKKKVAYITTVLTITVVIY